MNEIVPSTERSLRRQLRQAGLTARAIDAVWPEWWSADAERSVSATTELRYTLARRLGMAPTSLFEGPPRFVWKDDARFKNLGTATDHEAAVLASFAVAVGRCAVAATAEPIDSAGPFTSSQLRVSILRSAPVVGLTELLATCWALGFPVLFLEVFPLRRKRMHAVTTRLGERYALLLGYRSSFPAQIAYFVAHELGHIALRHVAESAALLDVDDPLTASSLDDEELAADRFALELLTGSPEPDIAANTDKFTATQLAHAVMGEANESRIDPGVLALCLAHRTGKWRQAFGALKIIPPGEVDVAAGINDLALSQLDLARLLIENQDFLRTIMDRGKRAP